MIYIDYKDKRAIYEQVVERFADLIVKGILEEDEKMPSVRSLAMELSINPNTIQRAYQELERTGYIYSVAGKGSFVSARADFITGKQTEVLQKLQTVIIEAQAVGITAEKMTEMISMIDNTTKKEGSRV
ncbi:MAG: GntR family transcriptional regulator [Lachnospiraceae bacterium]